MGVTTETVVTIVCDNPACPGNTLDPNSWEGWVQVTASVMQNVGMAEAPLMMPVSSAQQVFCSAYCAGSIEGALVAAEEARNVQIENQLPEALDAVQE